MIIYFLVVFHRYPANSYSYLNVSLFVRINFLFSVLLIFNPYSIFVEHNLAILERFAEYGKVKEIDASADVDAVWEEVKRVFEDDGFTSHLDVK